VAFLSWLLSCFCKRNRYCCYCAAGLWFLIETLFLNKDKFVFRVLFFALSCSLLHYWFWSIHSFAKTNEWLVFFPEHVKLYFHRQPFLFPKNGRICCLSFYLLGPECIIISHYCSLVLYFYFKKHKNNPANKPILVFAIYCVLFLIAVH